MWKTVSDEENTPPQPTGSHQAPEVSGRPAPSRAQTTPPAPSEDSTPRPHTSAAPAPGPAPDGAPDSARPVFTPPPGTPARTTKGHPTSTAQPEPFSVDSTMGQDARALGSEIKNQADPRRIAKNAVLAITGTKAAADAVKQTGQAVKASEETDPARARAQTRAPAAAPAARTNQSGAPGTPSEDEAAADARRRRNFAAQQPGAATGPGKATAGAVGGSGLGALGKTLGASDAGKFAQASDSTGGLAGDAKSMSSGAKTGAKIGAKVGGGPLGAAVGGVAGAAAQGLKTKNGRRGLVLVAAAPVLLPLCMILAFSLVLTMLISPITSEVTENSADEMAMAAATTDGVSEQTILLAAEASGDTGIPWEILAAIVKVSGNTATAEEAEPMSAEEAESAREANTPVGPYSFLLEDLDDVAHFSDETDDARADEYVSLSTQPFQTREELFANLGDFRVSSDVMARVLAGTLSERQPDLDSFGLGAGVILASADDGDDGIRRALDTDNASEAGEDEAEEASESEGNPESRALREAYVDALGALPIEDASGNAEAIFDQALAWYLGETAECVPSSGIVTVNGSWVNPVPGSPPPSAEQDFGPRTIGQGFHDGVDLNGAADGSPVVAASSGVATVEASSIYGPTWVKIDHGGGVITEYGHMASSTITTGQQVNTGDIIGKEGNEGQSFGIHLHLSVRENGEFVDPVPFFALRGVDLYGAANGTPSTIGPTLPPDPVPTGAGATGNQIRTVQSNLPVRRGAALKPALKKVFATGPDFVSFNEMFTRPNSAFTPSGYEAWRAPQGTEHRESMSTGVVWRTDRWTKVSTGRVTLVRNGPLSTDHRYANWVTVNNPDLGNVSFVSVHMPINPAVHGPLKERQEMYREGMEHLQSLVSDLATNGAVFVAGDMNSQFSANDPWGPRKMLGTVGLTSSFDVLGSVATHIGGGTIDYIFGQKSAATPVKQWTTEVASDHKVLGVDWEMNPDAVISTGTLPESWTTTSAGDETVTLDKTQLGFAASIAAKGSEMGVPDDGIVIAFMTVFVETKFKNYASEVYPETVGHEYPDGAVGSDHDSVGLFQQRPQSGWGDPMELLDPSYAASAFFGGPSGPNGGSPGGLLDQPAGWETRNKGDVAQSVQVSAFPDKYALWEQSATELLSLVKGAGEPTAASCDGGVATIGYTVGTFNILGWGHTVEGGNKPGFEGGEVRFPAAMDLLDTNGVSVAGLQEMHDGNKKYLAENYADTWGWHAGREDFVIWRLDEWTKVDSKPLSIPYFGGTMRAQAMVKLKNTETGEDIWFIGVHPPADVRGPALKWRKQGLTIIKQAVVAADAPVILTGDFNDRRDGDARAQCALTPEMTNAFGASPTGCEPPPGDPVVDHIFSTGVTLTGARVDRSALDEKISDHPLVVASVPGAAGLPVGSVPSDYNLGPVQPHVAQAANILGPMFGIQTIGGYRVESTRDPNGHPAGLALDLMVPLTPEGQATGDAMAAYAQANAASLKILYIIWNHKIWSVERASEGWRSMADRGSPTANHEDHNHISFQSQ